MLLDDPPIMTYAIERKELRVSGGSQGRCSVRAWRAVLMAVPVLVAVALTGCKASSESVLENNIGGDFSGCLTKQSWVGETADQDSSGQTGALSITTNRLTNCEGTRPANESNWAYFDAEARLIKVKVDGSGTFVCEVSLDSVAYYQTRYQAEASARRDCGHGNYWTHGVHVVDAAPPFTLTKGYTTTPYGYNA